MRTRQTFLVFILTSLILSATSCQKIELARTELTQSQWRQLQPYLLQEAPNPKYPIAATFADEIELLGLDVDGELKPGEEVTFTWYWKALNDVSQDWKIFVHLDSEVERFRQNLDHYPLQALMSEVYRTYHWREGHIIKDVQTFQVATDAPPGPIVPFVGLFRGDTRAPITSADAPGDNRARGPALTIAGEAAADAPRHEVPFLDDNAREQLTLDGRLDEEFWAQLPAIALQPIGNNGRYSTTIRAAYTDDALIIGATMEDEHIWATLTERDQDLWSEEVLELFFAPKGANEPYIELQINPLGTIFDARFDKPLAGGASARRAAIERGRIFTIDGLESAVFIDGSINDKSSADRSWSVELKVPFKGLGLNGPPSRTDSWLVNIYRIDRPSEKEAQAYAWSTLANRNFHRVDQFGTWAFAPATLPPSADMRPQKMRRQMLSPEQLRKIVKDPAQ